MRQANNQEVAPNSDIFPITGGPMDLAESTPGRPSLRAPHAQQIRAKELARQAARMRRLLLTSGFSMLYLLAVAVFYSQSLVARGTLTAAAALVGLWIVIFYAIFATGLNQKVAEKNLSAPIALCALATMLWIVYCAPVTRFIFAPFAFVAIAYAMYRVRPVGILLLSLGTLVGYGTVIGMQYVRLHDVELARAELLHWFVLSLTLPGFVLLTGRVHRLHGALHKASVKIRDIEEHARRDALTDCFNRRYMVAALEEQKRLADKACTPLCLAVIDLDHFKRINDDVGHLAGDEVLRTFARLAQRNVRESDIFGRYGGEEFLLILPETTLLAALNTAERIRGQIEHHPWNGKLHGLVTVSIGLTQYISGESVLELFSRTDTAMYLAKRGGRNQVVVEEPTVELWKTTTEP